MEGISLKPLFPFVTAEEGRLPFYLKSIGKNQNQETIHRPAGHPDFHWLHSTQGKGVLIIAGKKYIISEGMGFFFCPGIPHDYFAMEEPWETYWLTFQGYAVPDLLKVLEFAEWGVYHLSDTRILERLMNELYLLVQSNNPLKGYESSALLYRFLLQLKYSTSISGSRSKLLQHERIQPVVTYIEHNYQNSPSLEEMAEIIGVTPQHLCRLFRNTFQMRPFTYITRVRIKKAKEILIGEDLPLKEVAQRVGYSDTSYFCSIFKEQEGMTPTEFRKIHR